MTEQPWYRQFWPWFVISIPMATVIAGLSTVWIAFQGQDSLAVFSEQGVDVATERSLAEEKYAIENDITASLKIDSDTGAVTVSLPQRIGVAADKPLQLSLLHPTLAARDASTVLNPAIPSADGRAIWAGHFVVIDTGRRYAILRQDDVWRISGEWLGERQITLDAVADGQR